jgi:uncharacterized membrane protein YGL010W
VANTDNRNSYLQRLIGAAALDVAIYEEVEADRSATGQALSVVLLFGLAVGVGFLGLTQPGGPYVARAVVTMLAFVAGWLAWALLTFQVGVRLMPAPGTQSDTGELARTLGFSASPGFLCVFGALPGLAQPVVIIVLIWMLASMIVAVRQALDYRSTGRAIAVCIVSWLLAFGAVGVFVARLS